MGNCDSSWRSSRLGGEPKMGSCAQRAGTGPENQQQKTERREMKITKNAYFDVVVVSNQTHLALESAQKVAQLVVDAQGKVGLLTTTRSQRELCWAFGAV